VDSDGKPIAEARIDHTADRGNLHQTDAAGRFDLYTTAPSIVIRKAGFRSEFVLTKDAMQARITLQRVGTRTFPSCPNNGSYEGIDGWGAVFQFPKQSGIRVSGQARDIDYGARSYYIKTATGPKGITHGSGPMWAIGVPEDDSVWRSVQYEEAAYDFDGFAVLDARGQSPNGNRWRYLGKFGESASYDDVDETTAKALDRFLDGACLKPASRR
jgi:hypothetical protein